MNLLHTQVVKITILSVTYLPQNLDVFVGQPHADCVRKKQSVTLESK